MSSTFRVLGTRVDAVQIPEVLDLMKRWIADRRSGQYVVLAGMPAVMEARRVPRYAQVLEESALNVPDGMPLVWLARLNGYALARRVYGPELMVEFCQTTGGQYRHFLYGGTEDSLRELQDALRQRYGINVVGAISPPFRALTAVEEQAYVSEINAAKPDVLWVGIGAPKQDHWMNAFRQRLDVPVLLGVGAAFDFLIGRKAQAPIWMRENGLEWLYRLASEPRRLWRRYLIPGPPFVVLSLWEVVRRRLFDKA